MIDSLQYKQFFSTLKLLENDIFLTAETGA